MTTGFTIHGKLPSLNEVINKNRSNRYAGAKFKADIEDYICAEIKLALRSGQLVPPGESPCIIKITWHEATKKRDADNIQSSQKFILDALQKCGVLKNDSRKYVRQISHCIADSCENKAVVEIVTIKEEKYEAEMR